MLQSMAFGLCCRTEQAMFRVVTKTEVTRKMVIETDMLAYCYFDLSNIAKYCEQHACPLTYLKNQSSPPLVEVYTSSFVDDIMFTQYIICMIIMCICLCL